MPQGRQAFSRLLLFAFYLHVSPKAQKLPWDPGNFAPPPRKKEKRDQVLKKKGKTL